MDREQAEQIEKDGRLLLIEERQKKTDATLDRLTNVVEMGFEKTNKMFMEINERSEERASQLHEKFNEHQKWEQAKGRVNPSLVVSIISLLLVVGAVCVSFVNMSITPIALQAKIEREWLEKYVDSKDVSAREISQLNTDWAMKYNAAVFEKRRNTEATGRINR